MAIEICPECAREVSSSAEACPHCGYPLRNLPPKPGAVGDNGKKRGKMGCLGWSFIVIVGLVIISKVYPQEKLKEKDQLVLKETFNMASSSDAPTKVEVVGGIGQKQISGDETKRQIIPLASKVIIEKLTWHTSGPVMIADFVIKNDNEQDVKDIVIECVHSAPSGTRIDSNERTIYEKFPAKKKKAIKDFNMGFIHNQAALTSCKCVDAK